MKLDPLDILFSRYIRPKAGGKCEFCGKQGDPRGMHTSHFIGRRYRNTRWLEDNVACLCFGCHNLMHDFPTIHREFFVKRIGSDRVEQLEILARTIKKVDKDKIKSELKAKLKLLGG